MSFEFDPTDARQLRYLGYGPSKLPSGLDREIETFVDELRAGGEPLVAQVRDTATEMARGVLAAYAERTASLVVRTGDAEHAVRALVALVVGGLDVNLREALMVMAPIDDSIRRIGGNPAALFALVATVVGEPGASNLTAWSARPPEDRTLECMCFVAGSDDDGFRYQLDW